MGGDSINSEAKIEHQVALNELSSCLKKGLAKATQENKKEKKSC